jgi:cardiolipin synthase
MASRALYQRRHPSAAIAWVVMLTLLPYVALPLYFMFGSRKVAGGRGRCRSRRRSCARTVPTTWRRGRAALPAR